jgi:penicillin-insensitive murein endopeptidase
MRRAAMLLAMALCCSPALAASDCYGTVAQGRLAGGVQLPASGPNFTAYSLIAATMGRTYLHATAAVIVTDAYASLHASHPELAFVYGETGLRKGGKFPPHRTHQNGLSVDFFVPVRDARGRSVPLPTSPLTRFGYDIEFDGAGVHGQYRIDFDAIALHLLALDKAARRRGARIGKVIFDRQYLAQLFATSNGARLRTLPFMHGKPWVRHDEHYHVDIGLLCRPG